MTNKNHIKFCLLVLVTLSSLSGAQTSYSQTATENSRLIISFHSRASGIDGRAKREIDKFISSYGKEKGVQLAKEVVRWGKEGELDYCFKLSEISEEDQKNFVSRIEVLVRNSDRTRMQENAPCRNKRPN
ncbi:MAG: hypothetical protein AB7U82_08475 [Blastocatellales bacterium]